MPLTEKEPKALDKVICVLECCIKSAKGEHIPNMFDDKPYQTSHLGIFHGYIKNQGIFTHFFNFITDVTYKAGINPRTEEGKTYQWNIANNLLRTLKRIRSDQAPFQLQYRDKNDALDYIEMMSHPPLEPSRVF